MRFEDTLLLQKTKHEYKSKAYMHATEASIWSLQALEFRT